VKREVELKEDSEWDEERKMANERGQRQEDYDGPGEYDDPMARADNNGLDSVLVLNIRAYDLGK